MSNFPTSLDTNETLYEVHDALRVRLAEDYNPGDTFITVIGDEETMRRFSDTGIITLTEQCSEPSQRAIAFRYGVRTLTTFEELEILEGFEDVVKPKNITNVTQNVMAAHHNTLKDATIAIERWAGKKGEVGIRPLEGTLEARTNFIRNLALVPKAWFQVNRTVGLVPLTVKFTDLSFRLGTDGSSSVVNWLWDFGDNTGPSITTIEVTDTVPTDATNVLVQDTDGGDVIKTYTKPGIFDVKLTVSNDFGSDTVIIPGLINARIQAPDEAVIDFLPRTGQIFTEGVPTGGPFTTVPKIRSPINTIIDFDIQSGENPNTGRSFAGEELDGNGYAIDPIAIYTWSLADDLSHSNSTSTKASYSIGGIYDLILRVDTQFGAYRITTYEDCIDIVEKYNMWLWLFANSSMTNSYEYGLISESFKTKSTTNLTVGYDDSFLDGANNEEQQKREFKRNNGFAQRGTTPSGLGGAGLLYWASGRGTGDPASSETIEFREYNGFTDTYTTRDSISRPWNWVSMASANNLYFILGGLTTTPDPDTSPTNQVKSTLSLSDLTVTQTTFATTDYKNGADELKENVVTYTSGIPDQGHMSVYRSAWKDNTGYFLRNDGVGTFFRIKSFYKTSGTSSNVFTQIRKLPDMDGPSKLEGILLPLSDGVYFFNNSGSVSAYYPATSVWKSGGPGVNAASFRMLQDSTVIGFDDATNTLVGASDGERNAYLSYDYSNKAFMKFNQSNTTFTKLSPRPDGTQWQACIF